jgi:hypothetical protein
METNDDIFEDYIQLLNKHADPIGRPMINALIDVADTAKGCRKWLHSQGLAYTAGDVVAMTRLVLERAHRQPMVVTTAPASATFAEAVIHEERLSRRAAR